jgi:cell wall assembly regulator SMI1
MGVAESWERIADWYRRNNLEFRPLPGASEEQIQALEVAIGMRLPEDVRESYRIHDGTAQRSNLLYYGEVQTLAQIEKTMRMYRQMQEEEEFGVEEPERMRPEGAIKPYSWSPLRIPVTDNCGVHVLIDLDPDAAGTMGQALDFQYAAGPLVILARSWSDWLAEVADRLEDGTYVFNEESGYVEPPASKLG